MKRIYTKMGSFINCKNCNKSFYVRKSSIPLRTCCSIKCKAELIKKLNKSIRKCKLCGTNFYIRGNPKERGKYCSRKCFLKMRRNGRVIICESCGKEVYKPLSHIIHQKHHFCSVYCTNKHKRKDQIAFICKICSKKFWWSKSRIKTNNPTYCSTNCKKEDKDFMHSLGVKAYLIQHNKNGLNKIELAGQKILKDMNLKFREQVAIANKFLVDVIIPENNLIIQWDGEYWHCHPKIDNPTERQLRQKKLDESQDSYLRKCGYKIIRFWETDIKENPEMIKCKIKESLMI